MLGYDHAFDSALDQAWRFLWPLEPITAGEVKDGWVVAVRKCESIRALRKAWEQR